MARNNIFKAIPMSRTYLGIIAVITLLALTFTVVDKVRLKRAYRMFGSEQMIREFKKWAAINGIDDVDTAELLEAEPVECIHDYANPDRLDSLRSELDIWLSLEKLADMGADERITVMEMDQRRLNLLVRDSTMGYPDNQALRLRRMKISYICRMQESEDLTDLKEEVHNSLVAVNDELFRLDTERGLLYKINIRNSETEIMRTYVFVTPEDRLEPTFVLML